MKEIIPCTLMTKVVYFDNSLKSIFLKKSEGEMKKKFNIRKKQINDDISQVYILHRILKQSAKNELLMIIV